MVKISSARIDLEGARIDNAILKDHGEILVGGATGANSGSSFSCDISAGNVFNIILNATCDISFINVGPSGTSCSITLILQQDSTGSRTVSWPNTVLWNSGALPVLTTIPQHADIFSFTTLDGGRKWFGFVAQQKVTALNLSATTTWTWGSNSTAQLGLNDLIARFIPTGLSIPTWTTITTGVLSGSSFNFAIDNNNALWAWGAQLNYLVLGLNAGTIRSSPTQVGTLTDWSKVVAGTANGWAIKTDGTLWGWGSNTAGGLVGDNTATVRSSPVQIGTLTNWASIWSGPGGPDCFAVTTDGTLWAWGPNLKGAVGDNTLINRSSPVQIGTLTNWAQLASTGSQTSFAIKTDSTLWSWGNDNGYGTSGQNNASIRSSPVQVGTLTNWAKVTAGNRQAHAIKTDGTLWGWGTNTNGMVGDNTVTIRSSPVQIGTLTNWSSVSDGLSHSVAIKTDGTLWAWGLNSSAQLGDGTQIDRSSPVQIGQVTTWTKIAAGGSHTIAVKT